MKINKFLLVLFSIFALVPLSYYIYKLNFSLSDINSEFYKINILFFFLIIIILIIFFYLNNNFQKNIIIILISSFFSIFLFEFFLSLGQVDNYIVKKKAKLYKKLTGNDYDLRTKAEYYKYKLIDNKNIVVSVGPRFIPSIKINSLSGISNSETILCNESGKYSSYISDRYGFNNPDYEWDSNDIKYLIVGDSFLQGACVNRPDDIASQIRNFSKSSVINLGYGGNGPLVEFATLREYLKPNIENVLWFYSEANDLNYDLIHELKSPLLHKYLDDLNFTQNLKFFQKEIDRSGKDAILNNVDLNKFNYLQFLKLNKTRGLIYSSLPQKYQPSESQKLFGASTIKFRDILKKTKDLTIKNESKLFFIYLPEPSRYVDGYIDTDYYRIKKIINDLDIPFIDMESLVFSKEQNPMDLFPFGLPGHYNEDGYKKIAKEVEKFVSNYDN